MIGNLFEDLAVIDELRWSHSVRSQVSEMQNVAPLRQLLGVEVSI
jgi:hypothetical protein